MMQHVAALAVSRKVEEVSVQARQQRSMMTKIGSGLRRGFCPQVRFHSYRRRLTIADVLFFTA